MVDLNKIILSFSLSSLISSKQSLIFLIDIEPSILEGVGIDINQVSIKMLAALLLVRESGGVTRDGLVDLGINMILEGGTNLDGEVTNFIEQSINKYIELSSFGKTFKISVSCSEACV